MKKQQQVNINCQNYAINVVVVVVVIVERIQEELESNTQYIEWGEGQIEMAVNFEWVDFVSVDVEVEVVGAMRNVQFVEHQLWGSLP
jgi:hypothetical protein